MNGQKRGEKTKRCKEKKIYTDANNETINDEVAKKMLLAKKHEHTQQQPTTTTTLPIMAVE